MRQLHELTERGAEELETLRFQLRYRVDPEKVDLTVSRCINLTRKASQILDEQRDENHHPEGDDHA